MASLLKKFAFPGFIRLFPAAVLTLALGTGALLQPFLPAEAPPGPESGGILSQDPLSGEPPSDSGRGDQHSAGGALPRRKPAEEGVRLIVLMYHDLNPDSSAWGPYVLSPSQLEKDLQYLQANGFSTVTLAQLTDHVYGDGPLPEKPVLITFDDGNESTYTYAWPLLKQYGMTGVINVLGSVSQYYSENSDRLEPGFAYLTWEEIRRMKESGVFEFGNHSYDLHSGKKGHQGVKKIPGESREEYQYRLFQDLKANQDLLAQACGEAPIAFAYPFGYQEEDALEVLEALEFRILMGSYEKPNQITKDPSCLFPLRRFNRPAGINTADFFARLEKVRS